MPLRVVITGFGRFPGAPFNPTERLARILATRRRPALADTTRIAHVFRTSYAAVEQELPALIATHQPDLVLLLGLAGRTKFLRVERRAVNTRSALHPDVEGFVPQKAAIAASSPAERIGRARHARLVLVARRWRIPVRVSRDAGRYLCNFAYWRALELAGDSGRPLVQFIHVPPVRRGATRGTASKSRTTFADLARATEAILVELVGQTRALPKLRTSQKAVDGA